MTITNKVSGVTYFFELAKNPKRPRPFPIISGSTIFASEGARVYNMGFKMTGIVDLVGTDDIISALKLLLFE